MPKGRFAEDGIIDSKYPVKEAYSRYYPVRTELNVKEGCGTVVFVNGLVPPGVKLTIKLCKMHNKPYYFIDFKRVFDMSIVLKHFRNWILQENIEVLNVAGTEASKAPEIYVKVFEFLKQSLA